MTGIEVIKVIKQSHYNDTVVHKLSWCPSDGLSTICVAKAPPVGAQSSFRTSAMNCGFIVVTLVFLLINVKQLHRIKKKKNLLKFFPIKL